jgi:RNase P subunit RPR2
MKAIMKKTYCEHCHRLVKGVEQKKDEVVNITCPRCNALLWKWNGTFLRNGRN